MDPITAVGFAAGILNFIEFSSTLVRGTYDLYHSTTGTTAENDHISKVLADLQEVSKELHFRPEKSNIERHASQNSSLRKQLDDMEEGCLKMGRNFDSQNRLIHEKMQALVQQLEDRHDSTSSIELKTSISTLNRLVMDTQLEDSILGALYFDSMFLREDSVYDPEEGTFAWLMGQAGSSTTSNVSNSTCEESNNSSEAHPGTASDHDSNGSDHTGSQVPHDNGNAENPLSSSIIPGSSSRTCISDSPSIGGEPNRSASLYNRETEAFRTFLQEGNGYFFICGKAGSGKSTMVKYLGYDIAIQEKLKQWSSDRKLVFARFFFWNSGDELQMSLDGLYRALLFRILKQIPALIRIVFHETWHEIET
ncbi:hypothetical protein BJ170DRAFT_697458 [Xylariales sp. AK1849]|nr:hypothetical protein BJ170DRAFT_697458 [Xylariales sp. AK1849]